MSQTPKRKQIPRWLREKIIQEQELRCFYCHEEFSAPLWRRGRRINKQINIDHWEPFSFSGDNRECNIVASCSVCNGIKSDLIFKNLNECRKYIAQQRRAKGYATQRPTHIVSELRDHVPTPPT